MGLKTKLQRISESFGSGKYELPTSLAEYEKKLAFIDQQVNETANVCIQFSLFLVDLDDHQGDR